MEKKFINCFKVILSCLALFSITACNNFIKGNEIADQIRTSIDYANSSSYLVKVAYKEGTGNVIKPASGESYQKQSDTFDIKFEANTEYQFIYWEVSSDKLPAGQDINDYVQIQDPTKSESSVKFKKGLENVIFTPVIMERPRALSCTPMSTGTLALRDSKIQVIFNRNMDPSSIYYTEQEVLDLINEKGVPADAFLPKDAPIPTNPTTGITKIYGYKTINDKNEEEYIYKNILITDNEAQKNINKCFLAPYFKNPTTLIIPADGSNNGKNLPPAFGQIAVVLDKDFCYKSKINGEFKYISMGQKKDWIYLVNDESDSSFPTINNCILKYYNFSVDDPDPDGYLLPGSNSNSTPTINNLTYLENGDLYLYIDLNAADEGSGLESFFEVEFTRLQDDNYRNLSNSSDNKIIFNAYYNQQNASSSSYKKDLDISSLEDGVYNVKIKVSDRSNNITTYPPAEDNIYYYFVIDRGIYLKESDIEINYDLTSNSGLTISWPKIPDLVNVEIKWKTENDISYSDSRKVENTNPANTTYTTIQSLNHATEYNFQIIFQDKIDNQQYIYTQSYSNSAAPTFNKVAAKSNQDLVLNIVKKPDQTACGRFRFSNSNNTQSSQFIDFDMENKAMLSVSIPWTDVTTIQDITTNSGPLVSIQGKINGRFTAPRIYQITVPLGNVIIVTEQ